MNKIKEFKNKIKWHEDYLFGLTLYRHLIGVIGFVSKIDLLDEDYDKAIETQEDAINKAKAILENVKQDPNQVGRLAEFIFPATSGSKELDEMRKNVQTVLDKYDKAFPDRPKSDPLDEELLSELISGGMELGF